MIATGSNDDGEFETARDSVTWRNLGTERRRNGVVTRLSCDFMDAPGLLVMQRCSLGMSAVAALVRLRMQHAPLSGVPMTIVLDDLETSIARFSRRALVWTWQRKRTVVAAAAEIATGGDVLVQFVLSGVHQNLEDLEMLSLLSISKTVETLDVGDVGD